ncbi:ParB-like nuclease family protein [Novosphingobium kunmingense]|uniref:ParB-like nuclease family protein n=1 Tax=Novosphingobium kunmingense TaxID=1211806 RepID=A0A2N0HL46_9SPHN|nr:DUF6551 family protein [Novosphingobium kunmingense]PKB19639.1 ParB-like nuclease family protein [Novosphingobium kunmingense]
MVRAATDRLKFNPPLGNLPALQYLLPQQLQIDAEYQRSLDTSSSQALVRKIAQHWNWDLCQPLVVARREAGDLFVIDGQHRLAAARLRGDISQLPAVVVQYASAADEAASFVHLNQQRRPLGKLDIFKAAVASGDREAIQISEALVEAGLSIAKTTNPDSWSARQITNIGGIEASWRRHGRKATTVALHTLAQAFGSQILRYAGTIFGGIAAVCADEIARFGTFSAERNERFQTMLALRSQEQWRSDVMQARADDPLLKFASAGEKVMRSAWARASGDGAPPAQFAGKRWCDQCEIMVTCAEASACKSRFCGVKVAA